MNVENEDRSKLFLRLQEIVEKNDALPSDEKEEILELIRELAEAARTNSLSRRNEDRIKNFAEEIISKHSLLTLIKQQASELDALKRLSLSLTSSLDLQIVLDAVVSEAMRLVKKARTVHIFLYQDNKLEFGASLRTEEVRNEPSSLPRPSGLTHTVISSGETIVIENISSHPLYKDSPQSWQGSIVGIPLKFSNSIVGVMNLSRSITGEFTRAELRLLSLLADQAAVAISNASLHQQMTEQANTDSVTGLPNRRALDECLQEEIRRANQTNSQFSVVMMDLDGFKSINDTYGHSIGDEVLHSSFNYLAENMRATDFLARYGGDELTLIIKDAGMDAARTVTQKIIDLIANYSFTPSGQNKEIKIGLTAGIATYPFHSRIAGDLLRAADSALYHAKKHHRGSFSVAQNPTGPLNSVTIPRPRE